MPLAATQAFDYWLASEDHIAQLSQSELRHDHEAVASDMKDEKPLYALRTVIRMIWAVKSVQIVGLRSRVCETSHMNLSET